MKTKKAQPKDIATDEAIEQILCECLTEIPFVEVDKVEQRVIADPARPEIVARIRVRGQETAILAVVKENGQPRLVREAITKLHEYQQTYADAYGLVVAPFLTPMSTRICRQEGVGYLDLSGNCRLNFDFVFISKTGRIVPTSKKKNFRSWYSPRVERVLRVLFLQPQHLWTTWDLAMEAFVTPGQALGVKNQLSNRQWLEEFKEGFRLSRPDLLLDDWSENYLPGRSVERVFSSSKSVVEIETTLASVCQEQVIPYALMGFSAVMRFDPLFQYNRVSAYAASDLSKIISALDLTETKGKGNVSLWVPYDEGVLRGAELFEHVKVTSPIQTFLDLISLEGRGEKAANHIWENLIKPKWTPQPAAAAASAVVAVAAAAA